MEKILSYQNGKDTYEIFARDFSIAKDYEIIDNGIEILHNGRKSETFGETWAGNPIYAFDVLDSAITAYVNGIPPRQTAFTFACAELEKLKNSVFVGCGIEVNGKELSRRFLDFSFGSGSILSLEMVYIDKEGYTILFYVSDDGDDYIAAFTASGRIVTNEEVYLSLVLQCDADVHDGDGRIVFISDTLKEYLDKTRE